MLYIQRCVGNHWYSDEILFGQYSSLLIIHMLTLSPKDLHMQSFSLSPWQICFVSFINYEFSFFYLSVLNIRQLFVFVEYDRCTWICMVSIVSTKDSDNAFFFSSFLWSATVIGKYCSRNGNIISIPSFSNYIIKVSKQAGYHIHKRSQSYRNWEHQFNNIYLDNNPPCSV